MRAYEEYSSFETICLQQKQKRIGILGGSFNPVHNGHISIAYIALYEFMLGEVIFLPLGTPPHKPNEQIASSRHRLEMLKLAISSENRFSLSTIETGRGGITYTADTLELIAGRDANAEYYYIIGTDTLFELETWKRIDRVMTLTNFICIPRPGQEKLLVTHFAERLNKKYGHKIHLSRERGPDISSSLVRMQAAENKLSEGLVPKPVADYILCNRLYEKRGADAD
ncbi:MAG: nicotinate-nucleotide adenylyltransferase [Christensenellales bacterium]